MLRPLWYDDLCFAFFDLVIPWESLLTAPETSVGSGLTGSVRAWRLVGGVPSSAVVARRVAISSPLSFRRSTPPKRFSYPHARRLSARADIERVRHEGKVFRTAALLVRVSPSPFDFLRVGIVVPRHGQSAVDRNRVKRRIRELVRLRVLSHAHSADLVIWAQPSAYRVSYDGLGRDIDVLLSRLDRHLAIAE